REMAQEVAELIRSFGPERREMAQEVAELIRSFGPERREMQDETASDLRRAHQIWQGRKKNIVPEAVVAKGATVEEAEGRPEVEVAPSVSEEEKVLEVIASHPEGIRLVDIGNELGVDWRTLLGISRSIMDEGKVEKIDNLYYPKGERPQGKEGEGQEEAN
ncbi:MAG: hypothetical protein ACE5JO_12710, partial [Candidatus Binatia bacterium]